MPKDDDDDDDDYDDDGVTVQLNNILIKKSLDITLLRRRPKIVSSMA